MGVCHPPPGQTSPGKHPPGQTPPWADTPSGQTPPGQTTPRKTPPGRRPRVETPWAGTPLYSACWDTVNKWAVRILLECNLAILKSNVDLIFEEILRLCHLTCNMMTLKIIKPWVYVAVFCCCFLQLQWNFHIT